MGTDGCWKFQAEVSWGRLLRRPLSLACGRPTFPRVVSLCVCVLTSSPYKDTRQTGSGPTLLTSSSLAHIYKNPISK